MGWCLPHQTADTLQAPAIRCEHQLYDPGIPVQLTARLISLKWKPKSKITLDLRMTVLPSPLSESPDREDHSRGFHCVLSTWLGDGHYEAFWEGFIDLGGSFRWVVT